MAILLEVERFDDCGEPQDRSRFVSRPPPLLDRRGGSWRPRTLPRPCASSANPRNHLARAVRHPSPPCVRRHPCRLLTVARKPEFRLRTVGGLWKKRPTAVFRRAATGFISWPEEILCAHFPSRPRSRSQRARIVLFLPSPSPQ